MERVGADCHPLSSPSGTYLDHASNNSEFPQRQQARSPASSLIQSAARSVLDDASRSTIMSGEGSRGCSSADGKSGKLEPVSSSLSSLRMETLPAIPDEQDRRRFIGCLAAILASSYDYDEPENAITSSEQEEGYFSYPDFADDLYDDNDGDDRGSYSRTDSSFSSSVDSFDGQDASGAGGHETKPSKGVKHSVPRGGDQRSHSNRRSQWRKSSKEKAQLARRRYRRRRYNVLRRLLISSSDLLLLDKSVAKAFSPMLARVLVPQAHAAELKRSRQTRQSAPTSPALASTSLPTNSSFSAIHQCNPEEDATTSDSEFDDPDIISRDFLPEEVDREDVLRPFLESLTPGAGFRCLSLLLLQHLLTSEVGYDARIRHILKKLGVIVLVHDMGRDPVEREVLPVQGIRKSSEYNNMVRQATRKFESLEQSIAWRLIRLSESKKNKKNSAAQGLAETSQNKHIGITMERIVRGVKIGSAGIVAGTLFALTGGLAAPGIAAGVAAVAGSAAATAAVVTLTSTAVVTTIFGVGGGSLAAYKMQRRTQGLTEFEFRKETNTRSGEKKSPDDSLKSKIEAELFSTICISGWLRDKYDYQRPWGLQPTNPRLNDRMEVLERFYSVYRPDHVQKCDKILSSWKGEEGTLWGILREKYGTDPDHLFPLADGQILQGALTLQQEEIVDQLFVELGYNSASPDNRQTSTKQSTPLERMREGWKSRHRQKFRTRDQSDRSQEMDSEFDSPPASYSSEARSTSITAETASGILALEAARSEATTENQDEEKVYEPPAHLTTVWDYMSTYGGELYTVRWESELLTTICDCVMDFAMDVVSGATRQILKQTVLSALLAAVIWPSYLLNVANMIDGDWTLAVERADEAGRELAKTLLFSRAGRRPVTLVGFSFGARVIYSCLKELARLQEEWADCQELKQDQGSGSSADGRYLRKLKEKFESMREPASVVEDAIMMGLPNHLSLMSWKACRQVVAGRLVNCYSTNDLILSLMFQAKRFSGGNFNKGVGSILKPVCGTCPVHEPGVENIDVSDLVSGHQDYCLVTGQILERARHGQPFRQTPFATHNTSEEPAPASNL